MVFYHLAFPLLVLSVVQIYAVQVPVFLWGDLPKKSFQSNPLTTVSVSDFDTTLGDELTAVPFTVIFIEKTLSVEDLSRKNYNGETSFPYLRKNLNNAIYLPSVTNPVDVLNKLADEDTADHVILTEDVLSAEIKPESGKYLFISLEDAREGEPRADLLRRHNDFMEDMFTKLHDKFKSVVAIYTARMPSWTVVENHSRVRRQAAATPNETVYGLDGLRMYVSRIDLTNDNSSVSLTSIQGSSTFFNGTTMNTTLNFNEANITLNFKQAGGYWFFDTVTLSVANPAVEENLQPQSDVHAILGFSYRCAQTVSFKGVNETIPYTLTFVDLKIQPYFETTNATTEFGDSFNCVGFFSAPIWSGLFVVFILLAITFYGIMMMMDIRTMDRFDDPKGKTITINAAE